MKLSKKSMTIFNYLTDKINNTTKMTGKTKKIIYRLYEDLCNSYTYVNLLQRKYKYEIKQLHFTNDVIMPTKFNSNDFPFEVRENIELNSTYHIKFEFNNIFHRNVTIYFIVEQFQENKLKTYFEYVDLILMWLYILHDYSSLKCSETLTIYFYFTQLAKNLPVSNLEILDRHHVNTAFTTTCSVDSEIVVFRREEWFKVFIHETFHSFGLDFSNMNTTTCTNMMLEIFKVNSDVNLYESYCEFWAEIINILFCSLLLIEGKKNKYDSFIKYIEVLITYEIQFSFFQMVKILKFMGLRYCDLYSKSTVSEQTRNNFYKENTNVLSYFVIKTILINNYESFLEWCHVNNLCLIPFKKTNSNLSEFCNFIKKKYKTKSMLENEMRARNLLSKADDPFLINNLRMSVYELV